MEPLRKDEVDGITVWWSPAPGPLSASIAFRVGIADEPFAMLGMTHLVEHLALFPLGRQRYHFNATVGDHDTVFEARGDRDEVLGHLQAVAARLRELPLDRFDDEVRVLLAEGLGRGNGPLTQMARSRFGARSYGLRSKRELGLRRLTPDDVQRWATERFCAENATIWMTGEPPATFGLDLPRGRRWPLPSADPMPRLALPAYRSADEQAVAVTVTGDAGDFEVLRTTFAIARNRLYDRLRRDCAIIYDVDQRHHVVGAGGIHALLGVEHRFEDARRVRDAILSTLAELAERGPTGEELDFEADQSRRFAEDPATVDGRLSDAALDDLHGVEPLVDEEAVDVVRKLTPEACASALARALGTAIVQAPDQLDDVPDGLTAYAAGTLEGPAPEDGRAFRELDETECRRRPCTVTIGDAAMHWQAGDGSDSMLLPFDEIVAVVREAGDSHIVYLSDDTTFDFSPLAFEDGDALRQALVDAVGPDRMVPLDARGRRVEEAGERDLRRRPMLVEELYRVSRDLLEDEELVLLAEVEDHDGPGLLAVTGERIVFHYVARGAEGDEDFRRETPRSTLSDIEAVIDEEDDAVLRFTIEDIEEPSILGPMEPAVAAAVAEALGGRVGDDVRERQVARA